MIKVCSCHVSPPLRNFIIFWQLGGQVVPIERQLFWLDADFQYENRSNNRHVYDLRCRRRKVDKIRKKTHAHRPLHFQLSLRSTTFRYFDLHQLFLSNTLNLGSEIISKPFWPQQSHHIDAPVSVNIALLHILMTVNFGLNIVDAANMRHHFVWRRCN